MLNKILKNSVIVPLLIVATGLFGYLNNFNADYSSVLFILGFIIFALNGKSTRTPSIIVWNNLLSMVYCLLCIVPAGVFISIILLIIHATIVSENWFNKLTPLEKQQYLEEQKRQEEEQKRLYIESKRREQEMFNRKAEQDRQQTEYRMTHNDFGRPLDPKLPQNCKLLQIHVKYKNGTSGIWQKIGVEHEVRALLENDPRIENFDLGLLSPSDNGRYPEY